MNDDRFDSTSLWPYTLPLSMRLVKAVSALLVKLSLLNEGVDSKVIRLLREFSSEEWRKLYISGLRFAAALPVLNTDAVCDAMLE